MAASDPRQALRVPKVRAAVVAAAASVGILAFKGAAYLLTGSVAILSDAAESVVNVVAANVALVSLVVAVRPPDAGHQYGHGKAEYISGATEGVLICAAGAWIVVTAVRRLLHPVPLQWLDAGAAIVGVATAANYLVARFLLRISREAGSMALEADARHLQADVLTSLAVLAGLGLVWLTGRQWLDPVVGGAVGLHVLRMGAAVTRQAVGGLMDSSLPPHEEEAIRQVLDAHREQIVDYHALRARRVGSDRFIDLHLVLHRSMSVGQAHALCDHLEEHIREVLPGTDITIHVEPCAPACSRCAPQAGLTGVPRPV
ncbi:MAG: cation diffusion facilitator family transporter [Armatimonadota bacterium]|nr:cation diffusion facilitator family transporter [Armatimonadota bacterium]MDR7403581.1 cation diffusion facilitator family transporter [Armatimonadota bacterium]MDR7437783.1 cation diffusion facilitator family transporter [Armatimonadota bacterium]MDR7471293.1 cation diffusion facilitator family transporter [Armatimonadota bacterium]MDR7506900.1 cation diffusion facilitator family transporter [Armatimonadota bacterium]